nr:MAG TPA: hypothetical protein [Caudoviricetes sp.]
MSDLMFSGRYMRYTSGIYLSDIFLFYLYLYSFLYKNISSLI